MDKNKLILPITILLASLILGGFYYASEINKQKSIERQQILKQAEDKRIEEVKAEQEKKEYIVKRKKDCYEIEQAERKTFNNTDSSFYNEERDICVVRYKTNEYKGVDCVKEYPDFGENLECLLGIFTKEF